LTQLTERTFEMQDKTDTTFTSSAAGAQKASEPIQDSSTASGSSNTRRDARSSEFGMEPTSTGAMEKAKETISNVASQAGDKVASGLDTQKAKAAEGLGSVARALRQSSDQLREQNQGAVFPEYISSAANQVERLSGYLRSTNTRDIVTGVEQFARQQPALFVGGAFMLGLLGARFLKSSAQSSSGQSAPVPRTEQLVPRGSFPETSTYGRGYSGARGMISGSDSPPAERTPARGRGTH
jgi:hypothetical protein